MTTETAITPDVLNTQLSTEEAAMLQECETVIDRNMESVFEFGLALFTITTKKLHRTTHETVEEYMRERFGLAKSTFYQYRGIGQFFEKLRNCGQIEMYPANEFQVRPILRLKEDAWADTWKRIVETAPDGKVTGAHSARVVADLLGEQIRGKATTQQRQVITSTELPQEMKDLFWNLIEKVREARLSNLSKSVREDLKKRLQGVLQLLDD